MCVNNNNNSNNSSIPFIASRPTFHTSMVYAPSSIYIINGKPMRMVSGLNDPLIWNNTSRAIPQTGVHNVTLKPNIAYARSISSLYNFPNSSSMSPSESSMGSISSNDGLVSLNSGGMMVQYVDSTQKFSSRIKNENIVNFSEPLNEYVSTSNNVTSSVVDHGYSKSAQNLIPKPRRKMKSLIPKRSYSELYAHLQAEVDAAPSACHTIDLTVTSCARTMTFQEQMELCPLNVGCARLMTFQEWCDRKGRIASAPRGRGRRPNSLKSNDNSPLLYNQKSRTVYSDQKAASTGNYVVVESMFKNHAKNSENALRSKTASVSSSALSMISSSMDSDKTAAAAAALLSLASNDIAENLLSEDMSIEYKYADGRAFLTSREIHNASLNSLHNSEIKIKRKYRKKLKEFDSASALLAKKLKLEKHMQKASHLAYYNGSRPRGFVPRTVNEEKLILEGFGKTGNMEEDYQLLQRCWNEKFSDQERNEITTITIPWIPPTKVKRVSVEPIDSVCYATDYGNFEHFCYDDPELYDVVPSPAGCARAQGYTKDDKKRFRDFKTAADKRIKLLANSDSLGNIDFPTPTSIIDDFINNDLSDTRHTNCQRSERLNNQYAPPLLSLQPARAPCDSFIIDSTRKFAHEKFRKKLLKFSRSRIHGFGLYAMETIGPDEAIIEYIGEKIRHSVADVREKIYERRGCGSSYMFSIDADLVVDATNNGNYARFINHCCRPNCYARIVTTPTVVSNNNNFSLFKEKEENDSITENTEISVDVTNSSASCSSGTIDNSSINFNSAKRIIIYSKTFIEKGEELTYDYKFDREFGDERIRCLCTSKGCRRYLN